MTLLIIVIALALIFDFINGFHDAANSIATIVSTKVLTPFQAVLWAAFFNFVAFIIFNSNKTKKAISTNRFQDVLKGKNSGRNIIDNRKVDLNTIEIGAKELLIIEL